MWFSTEARFPILRLPLDFWHQNMSEGGLKSWFWVRLVLHAKWCKLKLTISTVCLEKMQFLANNTEDRQYIYQIEALGKMSRYVLLLSSDNDRGERHDYLKSHTVPSPCSGHFSCEPSLTPSGSCSPSNGHLEHFPYMPGGPRTMARRLRKAAWPSSLSTPSRGWLAWVPWFWDPLSLLPSHVSLEELAVIW